MKSTHVIIGAAAILTGLCACENSSSNEAEVKAESFNAYVDSVEKLSPVYTTARWNEIESGYQAREPKSELIAELSEAEKKEVEESKAQYLELKANYETKIKENDYRTRLRNSLFGEGKVGADMQFNFVTPENIVSVYENFVNTVEANKDNYSREDWDEIKVLYEALDTRKNEVEKDISSKENLKIAGLKIKFSAIKTVNRPGAKAEENAEAKKDK